MTAPGRSETGRSEGAKLEKPLIDLSDPATRRMIGLARKRGYVTRDELEQVLPPDEFSQQHVHSVVAQLSRMGIRLVGPMPSE
jgi:RNA polymerase primary sigma factor